MNYVVISKLPVSEARGLRVLVSFARLPLWKTFEDIRRQGDTIPNHHSKDTANNALKKYANHDMYMILPYDYVKKEYDTFIKNK